MRYDGISLPQPCSISHPNHIRLDYRVGRADYCSSSFGYSEPLWRGAAVPRSIYNPVCYRTLIGGSNLDRDMRTNQVTRSSRILLPGAQITSWPGLDMEC